MLVGRDVSPAAIESAIKQNFRDIVEAGGSAI